MADPRWPVYTVRYKTYLKEAIVEALQNAFVGHPDDLLRSTEVVIEFPMTEAEYPAVVVRFYGRSVNQAGVAHHEFLEVPRTVEEEAAGVAPRFQKFRRLRTLQLRPRPYRRYARGNPPDGRPGAVDERTSQARLSAWPGG
jgi:hypothetical protein